MKCWVEQKANENKVKNGLNANPLCLLNAQTYGILESYRAEKMHYRFYTILKLKIY